MRLDPLRIGGVVQHGIRVVNAGHHQGMPQFGHDGLWNGMVGHTDTHSALIVLEELGDLGQETGGIVGPAIVDRLAHVVADEEGVLVLRMMGDAVDAVRCQLLGGIGVGQFGLR